MTLKSQALDRILREAFSPQFLAVEDDSAKHAGHVGARAGGGHFQVTLVAGAFEGKTLVEQHRLVYAALQSQLGREIHALALQTYSPSQWKARNA
jgi:BolA protein